MDFDSYFPNLVNEMNNFYEMVNWEETMKAEDPDDVLYDVEMIKMVNRLDEEITTTIGDIWQELKTQNEAFVCVHTLLVLAMHVQDPIFKAMTPEEQNMMKWAALCHDLAKKSTPTIEGKDHVHPFMSAACTLEVFENNGFIDDMTDEKRESLKQVKRLLRESVQPLPRSDLATMDHGKPYCTQRHSHHNLPEIFYYLWKKEVLPRGSFLELVFRLVLFH